MECFPLGSKIWYVEIVRYFSEQLSVEEHFELLSLKNDSEQTTYDVAVDHVESDDGYANEKVVEYLHSFVVLVTVSAASMGGVDVKFNSDLGER